MCGYAFLDYAYEHLGCVWFRASSFCLHVLCLTSTAGFDEREDKASLPGQLRSQPEERRPSEESEGPLAAAGEAARESEISFV